jgi:intracellular septation protein
MKFLFDLFPVILFFLAFKLSEAQPQAALDFITQVLAPLGLGSAIALKQAPILVATLVVILATALQIGWVALRHGKVDKMLWVSLILVVFFGGLTLVFHDEAFIKWKPTVLYWLFAAVLLGAQLLFGKNLIRQMLEAQLQLPEPIWLRLNLAWVIFFTLLGILNLLIAFAFNLPTETWVTFKLFGTMGLMFAFIIAQGMFLSKYIEEK